MDVQEELSQERKPGRSFLKILLLVFLFVLGGVLFYFFKRPKPPQNVSSYQQLDRISQRFLAGKREATENLFVYSFKGSLYRMWFEKEVVVYEYDLGEGILLGQREKISLPLNILPFEYLGKRITTREELDLGKGELNIPSELKIWCRGAKKETSPAQVVKWAIYSLAKVQKPSSSDEISKKVLSWLKTQLDERGVYTSGQLCQLNGQCETTGKSNRSGLAVIWGRFKYFLNTKEPKQLEAIRRDLKNYTDPEKIPTIQNNFWNCRLMYDLWQSNEFSSKEKRRVEEICFESDYIRTEEAEKMVEGGVYQQKANLQEVLAMKRFYLTPPTALSSYGDELTRFSAYASDFATRFLWKKDPSELLRSKIFFDKAIDAYRAEKENRYINGRCVLGIASLDLYKATNSPSYLDFAKTFFEKEEMGKVCFAKEDEVYPNRCQDSLFEQATCSLFAQELFKLTREKKYKDFGEKLVQNLIEKSFDAPGFLGEFSGDGGFYSKGRGTKAEGVNIYKPVRENGLILGILND